MWVEHECLAWFLTDLHQEHSLFLPVFCDCHQWPYMTPNGYHIAFPSLITLRTILFFFFKVSREIVSPHPLHCASIIDASPLRVSPVMGSVSPHVAACVINLSVYTLVVYFFSMTTL